MHWKVLLSHLNQPYQKGGRLSSKYNISKNQISNLESKIENLINAERIKIGLHPLQRDRGLWRVANSHSYDMAKTHFFSHINSRGQGPTERARSMNYDGYLSENILTIPILKHQHKYFKKGSKVKIFDEIAKDVVAGWKSSPGHWENAMRRDWIYGSVAIAYARNPVEKDKILNDFDSEYIKRKYGSSTNLSTDLHLFFTHNFSTSQLVVDTSGAPNVNSIWSRLWNSSGIFGFLYRTIIASAVLYSILLFLR